MDGKSSLGSYLRSCRVAMAVCSMVGYAFFYLLRIDLSIAIVCMVRRANSSQPGGWVNSSQPGGWVNSSQPWQEQGEFVWSKSLQGWILSSFYYGYIVSQVPGGWLALRLGGKHIFGTGMLVSVATTLLLPAAARAHPGLVIALRVLQGLAMGICFPASHTLWGKWAPPLERSKLVACSYAGTMVGTVAAMGISGFICTLETDGGWPLIFYIYGSACLLWYLWWLLAVYNSPSEHPRISAAERDYIEGSVGAAVYSKRAATPWSSILRSMPVWAIVVSHVGNNWGSYTILSCIPMYMAEVLHFDIKQNGLLSAVPYICMYVATNVWSLVTDLLRSRRCISTTRIRKLNQVIATVGPSVFIVAAGYMEAAQRGLAVLCLTLAVTCTATCRAGYSVNHIDIAPRYGGILFGISNTAATIPGMVAPYVAAALTPNGTRAEWQKVFYICAGVYMFACIFYVIFASGEEQKWAREQRVSPSSEAEEEKKEGEMPLTHKQV